MHFDPEQQLTADCLLRQSAALRALGRRLLDDNDADDLAQETFLAALRGGPPRGALSAWLAGIAKRLALLRRRSARRQLRREQLRARPEAVASAADAAASGELLQRIAAAVQSLPESYRTPVLLRFWHDLPPRAIAAQLALPVNTVRSRLQRALGMLRERLDELGPGRSAWTGPFLVLVRPRGLMAGAMAGVGGVLTGVASMGMQAKLVVAAVALVGVVVAFEWLQPPFATAPAVAASDPPARAVADQGPAPMERREDAAVPAEVRGRCVAAENGAPLAGCRVALVADRVQGQPVLQPEPSTSGADGGFACKLEAAAGRSCQLFLFVAERVAVQRSFASLQSGVLDVGDVPLTFGARVAGTVHDRHGTAAGNTMFDCQQVAGAPPAGEVFVPAKMPPLWSGEDGVLQMGMGAVFGPGTWQLRLQSREHVLVGPTSFAVAPGQRTVALDIVVDVAADQPAIAGVLVDEDGVPVPDVTLCAGDTDNRDQTAADGTFAIHRRAGKDEKVKLGFLLPEVLALRDPEAEYAWGSRDLRVVARRPGGLWVQVVAAETGAPVEEYGVRLLALDPDSRELRGLREDGRHDGGLLQLPKVTPGRYRIAAYPRTPGRMPSEPVEATLGATGVTVRLSCEAAHALSVVVQTRDGAPVARSKVELFRQEGDGELTNYSNIGSAQYVYEELVIQDQPAFVVLATGVTNGMGRLLLHGPGRGRIGLRVLGSHVPLLRAPVAIVGEDTVVVLEVERGAVVRGTLMPAALLSTLKPAVRHWQWAGSHGECADPERPWPTLKLRQVGGERRTLPWRQLSSQPGFEIGDDGAFAIAGVPPGDWDVELQYGVEDSLQSKVIGSVPGLRDGETRALELDIHGLLPGELHATLTRDGQPLANAEVYFARGMARTDAHGLLLRKVPAGRYRLGVDIGEGYDHRLHSDQPVEVRAGEVTTATIDFVRRRIRLHILRPDGTPAAQLPCGIIGLSGEFTTDADGWLVLDPAPTWEFAVRYYAGGLTDAAVQKLVEQDPDAWDRLRVDMGPVRMPLDRRQADLELRMPR